MHLERNLYHNHQLKSYDDEPNSPEIYLIPFLVHPCQPSIRILDNFLQIPAMKFHHIEKRIDVTDSNHATVMSNLSETALSIRLKICNDFGCVPIPLE